MRIGLLPVRDHYYQPLVNPKKHLKHSLKDDRELPGIKLNIDEQLSLLKGFQFNEELTQFTKHKSSPLSYYYKNNSFESGDSEFLYNMIRHFKPKRIIEIGSGFSTLMSYAAITKNDNDCELICIEPYEMPWLEELPINVIRKKIEDVDVNMFSSLKENDILFIDSSHIIRPQGDVLFEYLELLPSLNAGVIVHIHDVFTPKDYLEEFIYEYRFMWNEQYLLEAFLTFNSHFKIIGAVNYLKHHHWEALSNVCPMLKTEPDREPGSFWIQKIK